jgi:hypothetical protein
MVYAYFANPFPFHKVKDKLGFSSSGRTPISRKPGVTTTFIEPGTSLLIALTGNVIECPEPAYLGAVNDDLPMYTSLPSFSDEVLKALMVYDRLGLLDMEPPAYPSSCR